MEDAVIYWIVNKNNGRIYIGSSIDLTGRWKRHRHELKKKTHHSYKLQTDFCHGDTFEWVVVESLDSKETDREQLLILEQMYINFYEPFYNITDDVFTTLEIRNTKEWIVVGPDGIERATRNLNKYCRENDLKAQNLIKVANGKISQHKGHKCRRAEDKEFKFKPGDAGLGGRNSGLTKGKRFMATHPSGEKEEIKGLTSFCKKHGLVPNKLFCAVRAGRPHKGFFLERLEPKMIYAPRKIQAEITSTPLFT